MIKRVGLLQVYYNQMYFYAQAKILIATVQFSFQLKEEFWRI